MASPTPNTPTTVTVTTVTPTSKKWKSSYDNNRRYNTKWETSREWLCEAPDGSGSAYCKSCFTNILPRLSNIVNHEKTEKHNRVKFLPQDGLLTAAIDVVSDNCQPKNKKTKPPRVRAKFEENEDMQFFKKLPEPEDEFDKIGAAWACELRKMDPVQQIFAKKSVNDILFEGQLGTLSRNSVLINSPTSAMMHNNFGYTNTVPPHHTT